MEEEGGDPSRHQVMVVPSVLVLGCSYGLLIAAKAMVAGGTVTVVGRQDEVEQIEQGGIRVAFPRESGGGAITLDSKRLPGALRACEPDQADVAAHDLVVLAMHEPQFGHPAMRRLMGRVAMAGRPCLSAMNMPLPPYLRRIESLARLDLDNCFGAPEAWKDLPSSLLTACSPDPQAGRTAGGGPAALTVGLASNFRAAHFADPAATALLRRFAAAFNDSRVTEGERRLAVPVRLRVQASLFVPLSKWSMLMAGNYRAVTKEGMRSIHAAVLDDPVRSRAVYDWTNGLLVALGAEPEDLVPFEQYARAARHLSGPSSVARALSAGAIAVERVDRLVQAAACHIGIDSTLIDATVDLIDHCLERNSGASG